MCNQTAGADADRVISTKNNSNQAIPTDNHQPSKNTNLLAPLLPKTPTTSSTPTTTTTTSPSHHHPQQQQQQEDDYFIILEKQPPKRTWLTTPTKHNYISEAKVMAVLALPMILTGLLVYCRSIISMLFLGRLGELSLAGGSLALGFANITGYSVLSGLGSGMEAICGQAFGAQKHSLLGLTVHRMILLLLLTSLPVGLLWLNMERLLLLCGQDPAIAAEAQTFLAFSIPDLIANSMFHPLRIYLRTQSITLPLTFSAAVSVVFVHLPLNWLMVVHLGLGIKGVALAGVATNFAMLLLLIAYISLRLSPAAQRDGLGRVGPVFATRAGLSELVRLTVKSCISVCLEWWWYEIMIVLCGLLANPEATVASMGILIQTTSLIYLFPSSLASSVSTRVGNELGADRPERAERAAVTGLFFSFILGFSALVFTVAVRARWASMFTRDAEIIRLTTLVLPIIGLCELGNCPQTTGCGVLRGTARPEVGVRINFAGFYLVGMPVAAVLGFRAGFGFQGLWIGLLAAQASCVVSMMVVLGKTDWKLEANKSKNLTEVINIDPYSGFLGEDEEQGNSNKLPIIVY